MTDKQHKDKKKFILDSTIVIHISPDQWPFSEKDEIIIPCDVFEETKSLQSKMNLDVLTQTKNIQFLDPSITSLKIIKEYAQSTGDIFSLSNYDLQVLALGIDHSDYTILSDDHAIQNVAKIANIKVKHSFSFIRKKRIYFWKCVVCGQKYNTKVKSCIECGSPVKRYFKYIK